MMTIIFILVLTAISIALRLASFSARAYKKIGDKKSRLIDEGKVEDVDFNKTWNKKSVTASVAAGALKTVSTVVSLFRNILSICAPIIICLEIVVGIILVITSSGVNILFADFDSEDSPSESQSSNYGEQSSNNNNNSSDNGGDSSSSENEENSILLIGDSRTVYLAYYVHGINQSEDNTVKGSTSGGDYIISKLSSNLEWAKENEGEIDSRVTSNTSVVINIGLYDAYNYKESYSLYIEWLNKKAKDWADIGATVYYMNIGPVADYGSSHTKSSHIRSFNNDVKAGLDLSVIKYIDLHAHLLSYGSIVYDGSGLLYDSKTYDVIWKLVSNVTSGS